MTVLPIDRVRELLESGRTDPEIGAVLGVSKHSVRRFRTKYALAPSVQCNRANRIAYPEPAPSGSSVYGDSSGKNESPLILPPQPFAVAIPSPARGLPATGVTRAVLYGDTHYPFHDDAALKIVQGIARDVKPHALVHMGDLVDCWQISRFDKNPTRKDDLQENIDQAREHLHQMASIVPSARRVLLEGNHEDRLGRVICGLEGAQRELAKLRAFQSAMTWPVLLDLDAIGWEFVKGREQSKTHVLPKLITKHGTIVRKRSGMTAYAEWEKYGASGASGHTHRLGYFTHRDHNGNATWLETGCTCSLEPEYGTDFDWQQGCIVLTWSADHRLMQTEIVSIRDGSTLYRDTEYVG